jgi:iron-sulfur cluster repair protein YtfE (RIC family)
VKEETMVTSTTEEVRRDHAQLHDHVEHIRVAARQLPSLSPDERRELVARILDFLRNTLVPHADEEERSLYPEVARRLGHPEATAPMTHDHDAIRARTLRLAATEPDEVERLQELLYGLYALISVHFWKEEQLYLPLVERPAVPAYDG